MRCILVFEEVIAPDSDSNLDLFFSAEIIARDTSLNDASPLLWIATGQLEFTMLDVIFLRVQLEMDAFSPSN